MIIRFSPEFTEWVPAIGGLIVLALGWGLALYTRYTARPPKKD